MQHRCAKQIDKRVISAEMAVSTISDGNTVLISGFGLPGTPIDLIHALLDLGARDLTIVANNGGVGHIGLAALIEAGRVRKLVCSYPRSAGSVVLQTMYAAGRIELEIVPQGTLSERLRAGAAGLGGFFTRTGAGTVLGEGKEERMFDGHLYIFERPLKADFALIKASVADRWGNLVYSGTGRNYGPTMAQAAKITIAQVSRISMEALNPETVVTPGIFVHRVVEI